MPADCCKDRWNRLLQEDSDMPVFTLLGKDIFARELVRHWIKLARHNGVNQGKIIRVQEHLDALEKYANENPNKMHLPD